MQIQLFDTTLRDGTQSEGLSLSVEDKLKIARLLDGFGIQYIEGGYPGSNPKDIEFFRRAPIELHLQAGASSPPSAARARRASPPRPIGNLRALVEARTPVVCIYGKSWPLHVIHVLGTTLEENLAMIRDSVAFLHEQGKEVIYDAEHFFDGFRADREYALATAPGGGRGRRRLGRPVRHQRRQPARLHRRGRQPRCGRAIPTRLGIHTHNDADMAVANALAAVEAGCTQVQGTMNGWGERCGNANLISIIPALQLKMGRRCVPDENLAHLTELSRTVSEIANIRPRAHAPYVGSLGVRPQGRRPRGGGREADRHLRAHPARAGGQPAQGGGLGAVRPGQRPHALGRARHRRARGGKASPGPGQGARERGLPVRGGRGLVRAARPGAAQPDYRAAFRDPGRGA